MGKDRKAFIIEMIVSATIAICWMNMLHDVLVWNEFIPSLHFEEWSAFETFNLLFMICVIVMVKVWLVKHNK